MTGVWLLYLWKKNPGIVDVAWAIGILILAIRHAHTTTPLHYLTLGFVMIWSLRLSGHLFFTRILKGHKDKRYLSLESHWNRKKLAYFVNYQFQGILQMLLSTGFYFIFQDVTKFTVATYIGVLLFLFGLTGEILADYQLHKFKKNPAHKGQVCNTGLWYYSRHPNYFFECLIWTAFACLSFGSNYGFLAIISPISLFVVMYFVTGPLTEKESLVSRGDLFKHYMSTTPYFLPNIFKK